MGISAVAPPCSVVDQARAEGQALGAFPDIMPPFLILLADCTDFSMAKTGAGLVQWRRADCLAQHRASDRAVDLGLPDMALDDAVAAGAHTLVVGVSPMGGRLPDHWIATLVQAASLGLDLVSGLHDRLTGYPAIAAAAARRGSRLIDLRVPPAAIPVGTGARRPGLRLLTVGADCAIGKKYTALATAAEMQRQGMSARFCATGQTGILISGHGVPLDAVPCDFISGAIEQLSPPAAQDHWDVIEGQGSLFHPSYAGVTLGLIHGAQADAIILCHEVGRDLLYDLPDFPAPSLVELRDLTLRHARLTNPLADVVGIALNTASVGDVAAAAACAAAAEELGVPAADPIRHGVADLVDSCRTRFPASGTSISVEAKP